MRLAPSIKSDSVVSNEEFAILMEAVGPFEKAPHLAVGCSGGADSLALTLLLDKWIKKNGGQLTALIVDHKIRIGSSDEAALVNEWLSEIGIRSEILRANLNGNKSSLQDVARSERYRLMGTWCQEKGVLHLFIGHHKEDQAETLFLNLMRGSSVDGLSGMASIAERDAFRILRPLLAISKSRLVNSLKNEGRNFVSDPSNENTVYKRVRIRALLPRLATEGGTTTRLFKVAERMAEARLVLEKETAELMAKSVAVLPEGYARLYPPPLLESSREIALRVLAQVLRTIGGKLHSPRSDQLIACLDALKLNLQKGIKFYRTLSGCQLCEQGDTIFIVREKLSRAKIIKVGDKWFWDGRFAVSGDANTVLKLTPADSCRPPNFKEYKDSKVPFSFCQAMPVIRDLDGGVLFPTLIDMNTKFTKRNEFRLKAVFKPTRPLSAASFGLVTNYRG